MLLPALALLISCNTTVRSDESPFPLYGEYLGQTPPGDTAVLFAPGIVNIGTQTRDMAITPDGKEIFFCMSVPRYSTIMTMRLEEGGWTSPEVLVNMTDPAYYNFEPALSSDGNTLFFLSNRPDTANGETAPDQDIWIMERTETGWGVPVNLGSPINTSDEEYYPSLTNDGTLYFTRAKAGDPVNRIYRSRLVEGRYSEPELLPENVNCGTNRFNAWVDREERFLIVPAVGMPDTYGGTDYYISFRDENDNWSAPVNMGRQINSIAEREFSASVSPDGKYLFFMSQRDMSQPEKLSYKVMTDTYFGAGNGFPAIYWIDASFIDRLR